MSHLEISVSQEEKGIFYVRLWNEKSQKYVLSQKCCNEKAKDLFIEFIKQNWNLNTFFIKAL
tara:strand:+ start:1019 stop:1204 length:186 start_codon:yes stop_codon:yes gene_type:complete